MTTNNPFALYACRPGCAQATTEIQAAADTMIAAIKRQAPNAEITAAKTALVLATAKHEQFGALDTESRDLLLQYIARGSAPNFQPGDRIEVVEGTRQLPKGSTARVTQVEPPNLIVVSDGEVYAIAPRRVRLLPA